MSQPPWCRSMFLAALSLVTGLSGAPDIRAAPSGTVATNALEKAPTAAMLPGKGPAQQGDWFDAVWGERRAEFRQRAAADSGAVVFLGDSITQGWGDPGKYFPKYRCANRGISGDTTRGLLYRLSEDVLALHPAAVVLLIGTNDIGIGADPADVAAKIQKLNTLVDEMVARDPQFIRCDSYTIFADEQGDAKQAEFPDRLHPNAAGYAKWVAALNPLLAPLQLPTAGQ